MLGHDVCVAAPAVDEQEREYEHHQVLVYRYPVSMTPAREEVKGLREPQFIEKFTKWLERQRPDIVHAHSFTRGCSPFHLARVGKLDIPYVVTVHTPNVVCGRGTLLRWGDQPCDGSFRPVRCAACCLQQLGLPAVAGWPLALASMEQAPGFLPNDLRTVIEFRRQLERERRSLERTLAGAKRVVAVSQWLYDMLLEAGLSQAKLRLSRQGIAESSLRPHRGYRPNAPLRIGYVGRFDRVKGVDVLIRALRRLPKSLLIELHLFGVAQGEEGSSYLALLRRLAEADRRIVFHGQVSAAERDRVLAEMDLMAVPSLWFETGPLVVLESFAAGLPVLGSDLAGIAERVRHGENGWLARPGDVQAWSAAIATLYKKWSMANWDWTIPRPRTSVEVALDMHELYGEVLGSLPVPRSNVLIGN